MPQVIMRHYDHNYKFANADAPSHVTVHKLLLFGTELPYNTANCNSATVWYNTVRLYSLLYAHKSHDCSNLLCKNMKQKIVQKKQPP